MPDAGSLAARLASEDLLAEADGLFRFALSRVRDRDLAEDLVQETLLAAVRRPEGFEGRARLGTWLTGILRNKIVDHYRCAAREKTDAMSTLAGHADRNPDGEWFTEGGQWARNPDAWFGMLDADPRDLVERAEVVAAVRHCVGRLPRSLQRIFALREFDDRDADEIGDALGLARASVPVLLHRSRQLLRECLHRKWRLA